MNDRRFKESATHILVLKSNLQSISNQELEIKVRTHLPEWISKTSTLDDTSKELREGKTFGFHYLVEGVAEAFDYRTDTYFINIPITLKR